MMQGVILKFFFRLVAFAALLLVMDRIIGFVFKRIYFQQHVGQFSQTTYAVDSARQDIMIFGSSRAVRHYASDIIASQTGLSCYNAGRDGQMIPYSTAVEEIALSRHTPKLVILDINPWELANNSAKYEKLTILLPYCNDHNELVKYISEVSPFERFKLASKVYPYNSSIFILATNALFPASAKKDENGYLPLDGAMTEAGFDKYKQSTQARYERIKDNVETADEKAIRYYTSFLEETAKRHIKTLVIISPTILKNPFALDNQALEKKLVMDIAQKFPDVVFLDYSSDPQYNSHPEKFADWFHLNRRGAEEFTTSLAGYITTHHILP